MTVPESPAPAAAEPGLAPEREAQLATLQEKLDVRLRDQTLLNLALQHGSFGQEGRGGRRESYERLEVLGGAGGGPGLGAVYVDSGFGVAHAVTTRLLQDAFDEMEQPTEDYKSALQELLQERERRLPRYRISSVEGPDHAKIFLATVEAGGRTPGGGGGDSKK